MNSEQILRIYEAINSGKRVYYANTRIDDIQYINGVVVLHAGAVELQIPDNQLLEKQFRIYGSGDE
jgi:hypothetical protein